MADREVNDFTAARGNEGPWRSRCSFTSTPERMISSPQEKRAVCDRREDPGVPLKKTVALRSQVGRVSTRRPLLQSLTNRMHFGDAQCDVADSARFRTQIARERPALEGS